MPPGPAITVAAVLIAVAVVLGLYVQQFGTDRTLFTKPDAWGALVRTGGRVFLACAAL